ncbi:hypothetical protein M8J76_004559 [Diaphorina citri]|nr:hypothetical protein M8J76_004559 [Diaphorina citri]
MEIDAEVSDDLTDEEEIEEKLIFMELDNCHELNQDTQIKFLGLDREKPLVIVNGISYSGPWEEPLGTLLILDKTPPDQRKCQHCDPIIRKPLADEYELKYKVDKMLKMSRVVIVKKEDEEEDLRKLAKGGENVEEGESSDDSLDEYYAANVEAPAKTLVDETDPQQPLPDEQTMLPGPSTSGATVDETSMLFQALQSEYTPVKDTRTPSQPGTSSGHTPSDTRRPEYPTGFKPEPPSPAKEFTDMSFQSVLDQSETTLSEISAFTLADPNETQGSIGADLGISPGKSSALRRIDDALPGCSKDSYY